MTLFHDDDIDDDIPDFDNPGPAVALRPDAGEVIARLVLDAALTRNSRAALKRHPHVAILKLPHEDYADMLPGVLKRMQNAPIVKAVTDKLRKGGGHHRAGHDLLAFLRDGRSILLISQDPENLLDETVLAVADITISIPPLTPALLRKAINMVTGGRARNVTDDMAKLPLPVIVSAVRQELTARQCVNNLQRALDRQHKVESSAVLLLPDLPLTGPIRAWTNQTLLDLSGVKAGTLLPQELVFATLEGPPGTGKTLIAESLARTAGWNFVPSSVGTWFTTGDGALGGVATNLKAFVDAVLSSEPAIGFMDELDALPDRATLDNRGRDWWTPVINLFLTEIDRVRKSNKKVLLLGATNYYDRLDDALIRPGRLQQRVRVLAPQNEGETLAVLRHYLGAEIGPDQLTKLARIGQGAVPAAVEGWVKQARAAARLAKRPLAFEDLFTAMVPVDDRNPADIRAIAIHEAGHAVVAHRLGRSVKSVSIIPEGQSGGRTITLSPTIVPLWTDLLDSVAVSLGGRAADIVLGNGASAGAEGDLASATAVLAEAHDTLGLRGELAHGPAMGIRRPTSRTAVNAELKRQLGRAMAIIEADQQRTLMLSERLVEQKILVETEIAEVIGSRGPPPALHATKKRRGKVPSHAIRAGLES